MIFCKKVLENSSNGVKDANFVAEGFADALLVAILCKNITTVDLLIKVFLFKLFSC